jgi:hypothetical protein
MHFFLAAELIYLKSITGKCKHCHHSTINIGTRSLGRTNGKLQAETANSGSRYTVAGGCIRKYGYQLKK